MKTVITLLAAISVSFSLGCDPETSAFEAPLAFEGTTGVRFYALGEGSTLRQALTDESAAKFEYEKTAAELDVGSLPTVQMRAECMSKIEDVEGIPSAVLIEPKSNMGVVWNEHDKITIKHDVVVNDSQVRVTETDIIVGGTVSVVHQLTAEQFKEALLAFKNNPCVDPEAEK